MVLSCCVALCKNNAKTPNISLHNFTKDAKLIKVWLHLTRRDTVKSKRNPRPFKLSKWTKICSAHFQRSDYIIRSEKSILKPNVIPTVFPWSNNVTGRSRQRGTLPGQCESRPLPERKQDQNPEGSSNNVNSLNEHEPVYGNGVGGDHMEYVVTEDGILVPEPSESADLNTSIASTSATSIQTSNVTTGFSEDENVVAESSTVLSVDTSIDTMNVITGSSEDQNVVDESLTVLSVDTSTDNMDVTMGFSEDENVIAESSAVLSVDTSTDAMQTADSGKFGDDTANKDCNVMIENATYDKLSAKYEKLSSMYKKLSTMYTDLVIEHRDFVDNCKCSEVKQTHDKSTNVVYDFINSSLEEHESLHYKFVESKKGMFSIEMFKDSDRSITYYTGFPNYGIFKIYFNMLFEYGTDVKVRMNYNVGNRCNQRVLSREDAFFLVLIKLRQNFGYNHLSHLFNVSVSTVCNTFISWINFMYVRLGSLSIWPHRNVLFSKFKDEFKENYPNVIGSLDATEIYIQTPSSLLTQSQTYSNYKHCNTVKGLVAIDGNGAIIFASGLFTGSISDNVLLQKSGFIKTVEDNIRKGYLLPGDTFLADKGFTSTELLNPVNVSIPVFRINNVQFSVDEVHQTQKIARERVHVERAIGRIKNFKILASEVPLSLLGTFNQIWTVCCLLSNFQMPLCPGTGTHQVMD